MKSTIFRFGAYGMTTALIIFLISFSLGRGLSYDIQEILGYVSIFISLSLIFFSLQYYKSNHNNTISFQKGMIIGCSITFFVAIGSAIADYIYVTLIYPDFVEDYAAYTIEQMEANLAPSEFAIKRAELLQQIELYGNPFFQAFVMFATVIILGLIISLIASFIVSNSKSTKRTKLASSTSKS